MADGASSAPAPAPAPVAARGRPTAAPGPIELSDEKTVQTLHERYRRRGPRRAQAALT